MNFKKIMWALLMKYESKWNLYVCRGNSKTSEQVTASKNYTDTLPKSP